MAVVSGVDSFAAFGGIPCSENEPVAFRHSTFRHRPLLLSDGLLPPDKLRPPRIFRECGWPAGLEPVIARLTVGCSRPIELGPPHARGER